MSFKKSMFIAILGGLVGSGIFALVYFGLSDKSAWQTLISILAGVVSIYLVVIVAQDKDKKEIK